MSLLAKHLVFVKHQVEFQQRMIDKFADNTYRQGLHRTTQEQFKSLAVDLELADKKLDELELSIPARTLIGSPRLSLAPDEIAGLPDEVLKELSITESDKTEFAILSIIEEAGGVVSLDRLIVSIWKKTGEAIKRQALTSRLYRMAQKDLIFNVPTKKGVYSNRPILEEEAIKLFGGDANASE